MADQKLHKAQTVSGPFNAIFLGPKIQSPLGLQKTFRYHDDYICKFLKKCD